MQADITGQRLKDLNFKYSKLINSTMKRAVETADIISQHLPEVQREECSLLREGIPISPEPPFSNWKPEKAVSIIQHLYIDKVKAHPSTFIPFFFYKCQTHFVYQKHRTFFRLYTNHILLHEIVTAKDYKPTINLHNYQASLQQLFLFVYVCVCVYNVFYKLISLSLH